MLGSFLGKSDPHRIPIEPLGSYLCLAFVEGMHSNGYLVVTSVGALVAVW